MGCCASVNAAPPTGGKYTASDAPTEENVAVKPTTTTSDEPTAGQASSEAKVGEVSASSDGDTKHSDGSQTVDATPDAAVAKVEENVAPEGMSDAPVAKTDTDATKKKTKGALLAGLRSGKLDEAVAKMEEDVVAEAAPATTEAPAPVAKTDTDATKKKTKGALLAGLRSGKLDEAVAKMEEDVAVEESNGPKVEEPELPPEDEDPYSLVANDCVALVHCSVVIDEGVDAFDCSAFAKGFYNALKLSPGGDAVVTEQMPSLLDSTEMYLVVEVSGNEASLCGVRASGLESGIVAGVKVKKVKRVQIQPI